MASEGSSHGLRENVLLEMESYPGGSVRVDQLIRSTLMEVRGPLQAHDEGMYSVLRCPELPTPKMPPAGGDGPPW